MLTVMCTAKLRDVKGKIRGYKLKDVENKCYKVTAERLKRGILEGNVECVNLTLTSDGRLVDKAKNMNNINIDRYYRYNIMYYNVYVSGLFRGINKVLEDLNQSAEEGDNETAYEDYEDVNRLVGQLEYILKCPNIKDSRAVFYYTESTRNRIINTIKEINEIIYDYGYSIKEDVIQNPNKSKIIYRDKDQIAIIN